MIDTESTEKNTMPKNFTEKMKWINWKVMLINFLKYQPGKNWVPLNYVVSDNVNPIVSNNPRFLDDYSDITPLQGKVFTHDSAKVHSYIVRLISEDTVAEHKVFSYKDNANGREELLTLKDFYEGLGANAKFLPAAENDIKQLFDSVKNNPHMRWE